MINLEKQVALDQAQNLIICISTQHIFKAHNSTLGQI
jgi:hypothetical protein